MLSVEGIHTYYGESHILQGVSLEVNAGELVVLLGRNGAAEKAGRAPVQEVVGAVVGRHPFDDHAE